MRRIRQVFALLVALTLVLAACGESDVDETTTTMASTTTTTTEDMATTTTESLLTTTTGEQESAISEFTAEAFTSDQFPGSGQTAFLTEVNIEPHADFDRITFTFDGSVSDVTYEISPVEAPITESPSGQEIDVQGVAYYEVTITPASTVDLSGEEPEETYVGPETVLPAKENSVAVTEVVKVEDFENVMSWVIGLAAESDYAHGIDPDENALIIDVRS